MEVNLLPPPYDSQFLTFFFVYVRISVAVFTLPIISNESVSGPIRAGLAFWITLVLVGPVIGLHENQLPWLVTLSTGLYNGLIDFGLAVAMEAMIGFAIGFICQVFLQTIAVAGEIIGQQAGFSAASVLDPITGQDVFLLAQINMMFASMVFIVIDGPGIALTILAESFEVVKPGEGFLWFSFADAGYRTLIDNSGRLPALASIMYKTSIQIAAPIIGSMLLISVTEAFLARTVPQLNILVVGFAIRISMSLIILISWFVFMVPKYRDYLSLIPRYTWAFLGNLETP